MIDGEFDVSEMSLAEMIYYLSRDRCHFIGIPVFPSRLFRHSFIFCRADSEISDPRKLNGKKIGGLVGCRPHSCGSGGCWSKTTEYRPKTRTGASLLFTIGMGTDRKKRF